MIKNIIFDWSGVIDDSLKTQYCANMAVFKAFGHKSISLREYREEFNLPYMNFYWKYIPNLTKKQQDRIFKSAYPTCPKSNLHPGMRQLLKKCRQADKKLILVTSDHKINLVKPLRLYGIKQFFDQILFSVHHKQKCLDQLIRKFHLIRNQTLFVGDTDHEISLSRKLGIKSAGVTWGVCTKKKMKRAKPDFLISNFKDLEKTIFNI